MHLHFGASVITGARRNKPKLFRSRGASPSAPSGCVATPERFACPESGPAAQGIEDELREIACGSELAQRLMTGVGVGPVVTLAYIATLDDEPGFRRVTDVGGFFGLTPPG